MVGSSEQLQDRSSTTQGMSAVRYILRREATGGQRRGAKHTHRLHRVIGGGQRLARPRLAAEFTMSIESYGSSRQKASGIFDSGKDHEAKKRGGSPATPRPCPTCLTPTGRSNPAKTSALNTASPIAISAPARAPLP